MPLLTALAWVGSRLAATLLIPERYWALKMEPMSAMPSAVPISRDVSLRAEATPWWRRDRDPVMAVVAGVMVTARPRARSIRPGTIDQ